MPLSKNAQKYSFRRIGPRGPLPGGQGPPPAALKSLLPAANSTGCHLPKDGPPAVILLLQARPQCRHSAKSAVLHKTRQRGTAATSMCTCTHSGRSTAVCTLVYTAVPLERYRPHEECTYIVLNLVRILNLVYVIQ